MAQIKCYKEGRELLISETNFKRLEKEWGLTLEITSKEPIKEIKKKKSKKSV